MHAGQRGTGPGDTERSLTGVFRQVPAGSGRFRQVLAPKKTVSTSLPPPPRESMNTKLHMCRPLTWCYPNSCTALMSKRLGWKPSGRPSTMPEAWAGNLPEGLPPCLPGTLTCPSTMELLSEPHQEPLSQLLTKRHSPLAQLLCHHRVRWLGLAAHKPATATG